jgi:hypothetical protein
VRGAVRGRTAPSGAQDVATSERSHVVAGLIRSGSVELDDLSYAALLGGTGGKLRGGEALERKAGRIEQGQLQFAGPVRSLPRDDVADRGRVVSSPAHQPPASRGQNS